MDSFLPIANNVYNLGYVLISLILWLRGRYITRHKSTGCDSFVDVAPESDINTKQKSMFWNRQVPCSLLYGLLGYKGTYKFAAKSIVMN